MQDNPELEGVSGGGQCVSFTSIGPEVVGVGITARQELVVVELQERGLGGGIVVTCGEKRTCFPVAPHVTCELVVGSDSDIRIGDRVEVEVRFLPREPKP